MTLKEGYCRFRRETPKYNDDSELKVIVTGGKYDGWYIGLKKFNTNVLFPNGTTIEGLRMEIRVDQKGNETVVLLKENADSVYVFDDGMLVDFRFYIDHTLD